VTSRRIAPRRAPHQADDGDKPGRVNRPRPRRALRPVQPVATCAGNNATVDVIVGRPARSMPVSISVGRVMKDPAAGERVLRARPEGGQEKYQQTS